MIRARLISLEAWPGQQTTNRRNGTFRVDYTKLLDDLSNELELIEADDVVLLLDIPDSTRRKVSRSYDGWPVSQTKPGYEGVVLSFKANEKTLEFACDTYWDWKDNLRAISLTLEALRAVNRYGATRRRQQYKGYEKQIPPPPDPNGEALRAAFYIANLSGRSSNAILNDREAFSSAFREASARVIAQHGTDSKELRDLNAAADWLKKALYQ